MKVGDLVTDSSPDHSGWIGIITGFTRKQHVTDSLGQSLLIHQAGLPTVFWNEAWPDEIEDPDQLEVISESR